LKGLPKIDLVLVDSYFNTTTLDLYSSSQRYQVFCVQYASVYYDVIAHHHCGEQKSEYEESRVGTWGTKSASSVDASKSDCQTAGVRRNWRHDQNMWMLDCPPSSCRFLMKYPLVIPSFHTHIVATDRRILFQRTRRDLSRNCKVTACIYFSLSISFQQVAGVGKVRWTCRIHTCSMTYSYAWDDSFMCVTCTNLIRDMNHSCVRG